MKKILIGLLGLFWFIAGISIMTGSPVIKVLMFFLGLLFVVSLIFIPAICFAYCIGED